MIAQKELEAVESHLTQSRAEVNALEAQMSEQLSHLCIEHQERFRDEFEAESHEEKQMQYRDLELAEARIDDIAASLFKLKDESDVNHQSLLDKLNMEMGEQIKEDEYRKVILEKITSGNRDKEAQLKEMVM